MSLRDWYNETKGKTLKDVVCPGYFFNKWIFIGCMVVVVLGGLWVMNNHGWDFENEFYYSCPSDAPGVCLNPFYVQDDLYNYDYGYPKKLYSCPVDDDFFCNSPVFMPGFTYGEKIPRDVAVFPFFAVSVFLFGLVLNHIIYRGKKNQR